MVRPSHFPGLETDDCFSRKLGSFGIDVYKPSSSHCWHGAWGEAAFDLVPLLCGAGNGTWGLILLGKLSASELH